MRKVSEIEMNAAATRSGSHHKKVTQYEDDDTEAPSSAGSSTSSGVPEPVPFGWASAQVRRQNRCVVGIMVLLGIIAAVYGLSGVIFPQENDAREQFQSHAGGRLYDKFDSIQAQNTYNSKHPDQLVASHSAVKLPDSSANKKTHKTAKMKAVEKWEKEHPGEPLPTKLADPRSSIKDRNDFLKYQKEHSDAVDVIPTTSPPKQATCYAPTRDEQTWLDATVTKSQGKMYEVVEMMQHDAKAFTQGLTYGNGQLWESTGLWGHSSVRRLHPDNANVLQKESMTKDYFGEGMTVFDDNKKLIQITWKSKTGFIYDAANLEQISNFTYHTTNGEGWGITWDECNSEFIVTDGSKYLHFWDDATLEEKRKVPVLRMDGAEALELNEIEFWRGRVLANVWYEDVLLVIDPKTGIVEKEYDFSTIWSRAERAASMADVFNGISVSADPDILYVTGKKWNRMFRIRLLA